MSLHLVVNTAAGRGSAARRVDEVVGALGGPKAIEVHRPGSAEDARAQIAILAEAGAERVVVLGGDGMVHQAANALAGTDTVLGIVAAGTGNDAATGLGLPTKLTDACQAALADAQPIDLIEADRLDGSAAPSYAITVAIVGLAVAINERAEAMRFPRGSLKYTVATLAELPRLERHELTVTVDGVEHDIATNLLAIANLPYFGGGMRVAPDADPLDGSLEVVSIGPANALTIGGLLPTIFSGRHVRNRRVTVLSGSTISIESADATGAALRTRADGEPWGELPVRLRVVGGALRVAGVTAPN